MSVTLEYWKEKAEICEAELARLRALLDVPEQTAFLEAAVTEAQYQRDRWSDADETKTDADWFWLIGYLVSKSFHNVRGKRVHHLVAAAAVLSNWHAMAVARGETMPLARGNQADHQGRD